MKNDNELFIGGDPRFLSGAGNGMRAASYASTPESVPAGAGVATSRSIGFKCLESTGITRSLAEAGVAVRKGKHPYHHRPDLNVFLRQGEWPSAGVELETEERLDISLSEMEAALVSNWFHFESDSSLNIGSRLGYELITEPLSPRFYRNPRLWSGLQNLLTPWVESWAFSQTGLHVHVGLTQFEDMKDELDFLVTKDDRRTFAKYLVMYLYFRVVDRAFSDRVFLRKPEGYCRVPADLGTFPSWKPGATGGSVVTDMLARLCVWSENHYKFTSYIDYLVDLVEDGAFEPTADGASRRIGLNRSASHTIDSTQLPRAFGIAEDFKGHMTEINAGNPQTIEFRRGKGTLNASSILRMVEFTTLLVRYAARMLRHPEDTIGPQEICRYMADNTTSGALKTLAEQQLKGD